MIVELSTASLKANSSFLYQLRKNTAAGQISMKKKWYIFTPFFMMISKALYADAARTKLKMNANLYGI